MKLVSLLVGLLASLALARWSWLAGHAAGWASGTEGMRQYALAMVARDLASGRLVAVELEDEEAGDFGSIPPDRLPMDRWMGRRPN